ncbi:MAG: hypothetical protein JKX91_14425, partial [Rhizobiaceae bacterium]|nr:hypothetical protein [Rhizobiaceae bacterium]
FLWLLGGVNHRIKSLPFAWGWTRHRDMPAPEGSTFMSQWREQQARDAGDL